MTKHDKDPEPDEEQGADKKERVLHTRVSVDFEEALKRTATELGTSVSGLVRHTLARTLDAVGHVMTETGGAAQNFRVGWVSPVQEPSGEQSPTVLGWQELVLNLNAVCVDCNAILPRGTKAARAVYEGAGPRQFLCGECLGKLGEK